jgi:hypothetical protein
MKRMAILSSMLKLAGMLGSMLLAILLAFAFSVSALLSLSTVGQTLRQAETETPVMLRSAGRLLTRMGENGRVPLLGLHGYYH